MPTVMNRDGEISSAKRIEELEKRVRELEAANAELRQQSAQSHKGGSAE